MTLGRAISETLTRGCCQMVKGPYRYLIASIQEAYTPTSEELFLSLEPFTAFRCLACREGLGDFLKSGRE